MTIVPFLDMGAGVMTTIIGIWGLIFWGIPAFLLEAVILRSMLPKARSFRASFAMNLASSATGFLASSALTSPIQNWFLPLFRPQLDPGEISAILYYEVGIHTMAYFLALIFVLWLLSLLIEGGILKAMEPTLPTRELWQATALANTASYLLAAILIALWVSSTSTT
jgi:hypothetical protein